MNIQDSFDFQDKDLNQFTKKAPSIQVDDESYRFSKKSSEDLSQTPESSKSKSKSRKSSTPKTDADKERAKRKKAYLQRSRN